VGVGLLNGGLELGQPEHQASDRSRGVPAVRGEEGFAETFGTRGRRRPACPAINRSGMRRSPAYRTP